MTVNDKKYIDNTIILDAIRSDPYTCAKVFNELSFDNWKLNTDLKNNFYIIQGSKDKIVDIKNVKTLGNQLCCPIFYRKNVGHTVILEDYECLLSFVRNIITS